MKISFGVYATVFLVGLAGAADWYTSRPDVVAAREKQFRDADNIALASFNQKLKNTPGMEDCTSFRVPGYASVIRCPNSTVSTETGGKFNQKSVTNSN